MNKRYIYYDHGEWYVFYPSSSGAMLGETIGPQGFRGDKTKPQPGDIFLQGYGVRGRSPLPNLPEGLCFDGPYGLDDNIWVVKESG